MFFLKHGVDEDVDI